MVREGKKAAEKGEKEQPERLLENRESTGTQKSSEEEFQEEMMNSMRCQQNSSK